MCQPSDSGRSLCHLRRFKGLADAREKHPERVLVDVSEDAVLDDDDRLDARRLQLPIAHTHTELDLLDARDQHRQDITVLFEDDDMRSDDLLFSTKRRLEEVLVDNDRVPDESEPRISHFGSPATSRMTLIFHQNPRSPALRREHARPAQRPRASST